MYEGTFVCTLMANEPRADIEIRTNPRLTTATISASTTATTRIRFSRKLRTMQIFSSAPSLSKKTMFCTARGIPTEAGDWALLSKNEKECQAALLDFLRAVEAVEGLSRDGSEPLFAISTERLSKHSVKWEAAQFVPSAVPPRGEGDTHRQVTSLPKPAAAPALPLPLPSTTAPPPFGRSANVTVSPRPRFPSALPRVSSDTFRRASSTAVSDAPPAGGDPLGARAENAEAWRDLSGESRLQTRFMPGVGWCVRSGGARYRIMFTDGVALEVDVEEERVEMVERDGSAARSGNTFSKNNRSIDGGIFIFFLPLHRYTVRDCSASRKVGDRMKVFREFLPLFDESDP
jgi:polo-like kinase 4